MPKTFHNLMSIRRLRNRLILRSSIVIFTDYTSKTVIASFFSSAENTNSSAKAVSRFTLWWMLATAQIRVESPDHQEVSYLLDMEREITVRLGNSLRFQVRWSQHTFGEGSFLIEFKLVDPEKVPKALQTARKLSHLWILQEILP